MKKDNFFEKVGDKLHYIVYCLECGKKYEDTTDYFDSANWNCDSEVCDKNWERYYNGEHKYLLKAGWIDIHPMYEDLGFNEDAGFILRNWEDKEIIIYSPKTKKIKE